MDNKTLSKEVIRQIEQRNIVPLPRWQVLLKGNIFWSFSGVSIVVGGLAISIIIAAFIDYDPGARTAPILEDIIQTIPYLWLIVFGLFTAIANYGIRHTKMGYRYSLLKICSAVILASLVLGIILNMFDVPQNIHNYLMHTLPFL
jgi:hypothetical protein